MSVVISTGSNVSSNVHIRKQKINGTPGSTSAAGTLFFAVREEEDLSTLYNPTPIDKCKALSRRAAPVPRNSPWPYSPMYAHTHVYRFHYLQKSNSKFD